MKKKLVLLSLLSVLYITTNAQYSQPTKINSKDAVLNASLLSKGNLFTPNTSQTTSAKDHDFYLQRSRNQRITGFVLLGTGLVSSGIALLLATGNNTNYNSNNGSTAAALFIIGAATGIASIPFMVLAHVNKNKAKVEVTGQKTGLGLPRNIGKEITGITLSIPIGK